MSEFTEFLLFKRKYEKLARDRKVERMNLQMLDGDWKAEVADEMFIDMMNQLKSMEARIKALEDILKPE